MSEVFVWPDLNSRPADPVAAEELRRQAVEQGRAEGHARGLEEGRAAARAEIEALREQVTRAVADIEQAIVELRCRKADELARVLHALCRKVLGWELTTSTEALEEIVAEGMSRLEAAAGEAEVYLHPEDHAVIVASYHGNLPLHADPRVPRCGVSVRLPTQAADFHPGELIDELFEDVRDGLAG